MIGGGLETIRAHGTPPPAAPAAGMSGGSKRRKQRGRSKRKGVSKRKYVSKRKTGGEGIIATAAVPFGLLALQRYFKGSKTSKRSVKNMGRSFKRTFRRRR